MRARAEPSKTCRVAGQGTRAVAGGHAAADTVNTVARSGHLAKRIMCVRAPSIGTRGVGTSLADKGSWVRDQRESSSERQTKNSRWSSEGFHLCREETMIN